MMICLPVNANSMPNILSDVSEKLQDVLILEDNVDFEPNFRGDLEQVLEEAHRLAPQWDLM